MLVEMHTGVHIDRTPVGAGMRVGVPSDLGGYLLERGWARQVGTAHRLADGRTLIAFKAREIPGTSEELSEWSSWMRPAWVRPDGRAVLSGDDRQWVPVRCRLCPRYSYAPKERLPAGVALEDRSDAWVIECRHCRPRT